MRELERKPGTSALSEALPPILVIGRGRVGGAFATAGSALGLPITLAGRDGAAAAAAGRYAAIYLCVPDAEIDAACRDVVAAGGGDTLIGHASGALGLDALAAATEAGGGTFCLHPLQTIPDPTSALAGAPAAIDGSSPEALALARDLATALGMRPFEVAAEARAAYHAAACIASNFLIAIEESAAGLLEAAGVEDGRELLTPLVLRTAGNWTEQGAAGLTGPIARGDRATVERHLAAIKVAAPELIPLYVILAERTRQIAESSNGEPSR